MFHSCVHIFREHVCNHHSRYRSRAIFRIYLFCNYSNIYSGHVQKIFYPVTLKYDESNIDNRRSVSRPTGQQYCCKRSEPTVYKIPCTINVSYHAGRRIEKMIFFRKKKKSERDYKCIFDTILC